VSKILGFKLFVTLLALALLWFKLVLWKRLRHYSQRTRAHKIFATLYFTMVLGGQSALWFIILYPGRGLALGYYEWFKPVYAILLAINYAHLFWLLPFVLVWSVSILLRRVSWQSADSTLSRSEFLITATSALHLFPAATTAAAISGMFLGSKEIWVNEKSIRIANLHDDLKGLRLGQISDIHIGNLIGEKYLHFATDMIRAAKVDALVVTGDIIDSNNAFLPVARNFFQDLYSITNGKLYGVMGNHDYIDDGPTAGKTFDSSGLTLLVNRVALLTRGRGKLQIAGLDYPPIGAKRMPIMENYFAQVKPRLKSELPTILLNHHPSDFEFLKMQKIDLVLSGHTHGGQISFSKKRDSLSNGARWLYKYYVDHYEEGGAQLYVNRGLGHWFPLRVECPPEITIFTLS